MLFARASEKVEEAEALLRQLQAAQDTHAFRALFNGTVTVLRPSPMRFRQKAHT